MYFKSINDIPEAIRNILPEGALQLFMDVYNECKKLQKPDGQAASTAWMVIKQDFKKDDTTKKYIPLHDNFTYSKDDKGFIFQHDSAVKRLEFKDLKEMDDITFSYFNDVYANPINLAEVKKKSDEDEVDNYKKEKAIIKKETQAVLDKKEKDKNLNDDASDEEIDEDEGVFDLAEVKKKLKRFKRLCNKVMAKLEDDSEYQNNLDDFQTELGDFIRNMDTTLKDIKDVDSKMKNFIARVDKFNEAMSNFVDFKDGEDMHNKLGEISTIKRSFKRFMNKIEIEIEPDEKSEEEIEEKNFCNKGADTKGLSDKKSKRQTHQCAIVLQDIAFNAIDNNSDRKTYDVQVFKYGEFFYPGWMPNEFDKIIINDRFIDGIINNFNDKTLDNCPVCKDHIDSVDSNIGNVLSVYKRILDDKNKDGLYATIEVLKANEIESIDNGLIRSVSASFLDNYQGRETLEDFGPVMNHLAVVTEPFLKGMDKFKEVKFSDFNDKSKYIILEERNMAINGATPLKEVEDLRKKLADFELKDAANKAALDLVQSEFKQFKEAEEEKSIRNDVIELVKVGKIDNKPETLTRFTEIRKTLGQKSFNEMASSLKAMPHFTEMGSYTEMAETEEYKKFSEDLQKATRDVVASNIAKAVEGGI